MNPLDHGWFNDDNMDPRPLANFDNDIIDSVICLKEPTYSFNYCFKEESLYTEFDFCECPGLSNQGKFLLTGWPVPWRNGDCLRLQLMRAGNITGYYSVEVKVKCNDREEKETFITEAVTSELLRDCFESYRRVYFTLEFKFSERRTLVDDVKKYFNEGQSITIVGSDGEVTVPKRLLKIRSSALKAMFKSDMEESRSLTVDLSKEFNLATLTAFKNFLITDIIDEDIATEAAGLYRLGDKYLIEPLKQAAKYFIMKDIRRFDHEKIFDVMIQADDGFIKSQLSRISEELERAQIDNAPQKEPVSDSDE